MTRLWYIQRLAEENIEKALKRYKTILLVGARQVCKTRLLKELFKEYKYINFDDSFLADEASKDGKLYDSCSITYWANIKYDKYC